MSSVNQQNLSTYGKSAEHWRDRDTGPKRYSLRTKSDPLNKSDHCPTYPGGGGSFVAGTIVSLENNRCVTIEHLQENDRIVGWHGKTGIVSSEKQGLTAQKQIMAFGFNDDVPFFMACHPFWTQDGWRAIDPSVAKMENEWLDIGQIQPGDHVRKIKSINNGNIEYEWVKIDRIGTKLYPAGTRFYGVHTREGPRSYHANGYLVCQNYPEITIQRVAEGLANVSPQEQKKVKERLQKLGPSLHKIMGPAPAKAILALCEKRAEGNWKPQKPKTKKFNVKEFTLPRMQLNYSSVKISHGSYLSPEKMAFIKGHLFLDGQYVKEKAFIEENILQWTRPVPGGMWEHGCMRFLDESKFSGRGFVCVTRSRNDATALQTVHFTGIVCLDMFQHYKGSKTDDPEKSTFNGNDWTELGKLQLGFECHAGGSRNLNKISILPNLPTMQNLKHQIYFGTDYDNNHVVSVRPNPAYIAFLGYVELHGVFNWDCSSFTGYCVEYDPYDESFRGDAYEWKGTSLSGLSNETEQLYKIAAQECLKSSIHGPGQIEDEFLRAPVSYELRKAMNDDLSVDELFLLTPPDPKLMHDLTFSLVQKCMKYDMDEDNLHNILGTVKPTLSGTEQEVADAYPDFFGNRFANAYLMNALSQDSTFEDKFTEEMNNKLLYFWAGNDEGCLSRDPEYNMANNKLSREAYLEQIPRVKDYINSDKGGAGWAEEFYDYITTDEMLNNFALLTHVDQDMTKIQKQSMVLYCLTDKPRPDNPDQNYAADFYCTVLTERLGLSSDYFDGNESVEEMMTEIIGDLLGQLITEILAGGDEGTKELIAEYKSQLQDYADAYGISMEEFVSAGLAQMVTDATHVISFYIKEFGTQWERFFGAAKKWMDGHPNIAKAWNALSSCLSLAFYGLGIISTVMAFMGWDNLPTEAKVALIADTVSMALKAFSTVGPKMLGYFDEACKLGQQTFDWMMNFMTVTSDEAILTGYRTLITEGGSAVEGVELTTNEAVARAVQATEGDMEVMTTKWGKMFKTAGELAEVCGVIASAAGCVLLGFQIYNDFKTGASVPIKVLDIIQGASFAIVTLTGAIGLFVEIECLPVIGQVASIVGIVAMVLVWIFGRDPPDPKPPAQVYIEGEGGDYVESLKAPSQEWLDNYHKQHPDEPEKID
eukprot:gene9481-biopygen7824